MPGSIPATSQLDWLISTTAMIVLSWSKATRDLLKSFGWGIRALHQLVAATMVPFPRRLPHTISPLEEDGFELSVPLVSRGAIRREFPKRGARLAASWGVELRRRSSIWEFDPTSRDQTRGILLRHLDDAIQADGDMPV